MLAGIFGAILWTATLGAVFLTVFLAAAAGAFFTAVFLRAVFFSLAFFGTAGSGFSASFAAWNAAHRFLVAAMMAFLPAADNFRLGFGDSDLDVGSERSTGGFFVVPEDACKLRAFFALVTAAFAA